MAPCARVSFGLGLLVLVLAHSAASGWAMRARVDSHRARAQPCAGWPEFRHNPCGPPVAGTLVVKCARASGLKKVHMLGGNSYCRMRIVDVEETEVRGVWNKYSKFAPKSANLTTSGARREDDGVKWDEAFGFEFMCPQFPKEGRNYQLEVTIKSAGLFNHEMQGVAYKPLKDLMSLGPEGLVEEIDLATVLRADALDPREMPGSLELSYRWCGPGDAECVGEVQDSTSSECGMSCSHALQERLVNRVVAARRQIYEAKQDESDQYSQYENLAPGSWKAASQKIRKLTATSAELARETCGPAVAQAVARAVRMQGLDAKPTRSAVKQALKALEAVEGRIKGIFQCLDGRWWKGFMLPNKNEVDDACFETSTDLQ